MKPEITVTNKNKFGKITNKWYVKVGKSWRPFGQDEWVKDGVEWIQQQLKGAA